MFAHNYSQGHVAGAIGACKWLVTVSCKNQRWFSCLFSCFTGFTWCAL